MRNQGQTGRSEPLSRRDLLLGRGQALPPRAVASVGADCFMARGIACRICEDSCEADAFRFQPLLGGRAEVTVAAARCTGCTDCVAHCPAGAIAMAAPKAPARASESRHD